MIIRPLQNSDSYEELTQVVRSAYKQLADMGFRYWGTWQSVEDTKYRCSTGHCLIAESKGKLLGTITLKENSDDGDPELYQREDVNYFTQFAVHPDYQRSGIGSYLLDQAERLAFECGAGEIALDTAEGATHLKQIYQKRGYRVVGTVDWNGTNYLSILMSKRLRPTLETERLTLAPLTANDIPFLVEMWEDERFQCFYPPGRLSPEHCQEVHADALESMGAFPWKAFYWIIKLKGECIGEIRIDVNHRSKSASLGYGLSSSHWRRGYATEAVKGVLRYLFDELNFHRVQAWVYEPNKASQELLKKLGFQYEGAMRERCLWGDERVDDLVFGILNREWNEATTSHC